MFIDNYHRLCNNINIAPSAVAERIGLKRAAYTRWKNGTVPTDATIAKLADFFGVSPAELTEGTKNATIPEDDDIRIFVEEMRTNYAYRALCTAGMKLSPSKQLETAAFMERLREPNNDN